MPFISMSDFVRNLQSFSAGLLYPKNEMFIDFMGDKGGARLTYGGKFEFYDGSTLKTEAPEYDIPDMYEREDRDFLASIDSGVKNRNHIDNILESAKLLDRLYASAEAGRELEV